MSFLGGFFNSLNYSTDIVSGAIDIVVVRQPDGHLRCTPFHVRFGRLKLLRSREKVIRIMINGKLTSLCMKIGEAGEAYFVHETEGPVRAEYVSSPIASPAVSPTEMLRQVEEHRAKMQAESDQLQQQLKLQQQHEEQTVGEGQIQGTVGESREVTEAGREIILPLKPQLGHSDEVDEEVASISASIAQQEDILVEKHDSDDGKIVFRPIDPAEQQQLIDRPPTDMSLRDTLESADANTTHTAADDSSDDSTGPGTSSKPRTEKSSNWSWMWGELPVKFGSWFGFQRSSDTTKYSTSGEEFISPSPNSYREQQFLEILAKDYQYDALRGAYIEPKSPTSESSGSEGSGSRARPRSTGGPESPEHRKLDEHILKIDTRVDANAGESQVTTVKNQSQPERTDSASPDRRRPVADPSPNRRRPTNGMSKQSDKSNCAHSAGASNDEEEEGDLLIDDEEAEGDHLIHEFDIDEFDFESPKLESASSPYGGDEAMNSHRRDETSSKLPSRFVKWDGQDLDDDTMEKLSSSLTPSLPPHMDALRDRDEDSRLSRSLDNSFLAEQYERLKREKKNSRQDTGVLKINVSPSSSDSGELANGDRAESPKTASPHQKQQRSGWKTWFGLGNSAIEQSSPPSPSAPQQQQQTHVAQNVTREKEDKPPSPEYYGEEGDIVYTKSLRPTAEQLQSLNLREGRNEIQFIVTSRFQGTQELSSNIYLWDYDTKIVISDVDGTITRSDALGHILPMIGRDWSHEGIAQLYSNIRANGYSFLYLTSRSIIQAGQTRGYISGLKQGSSALPEGPVIMAPDRLFECLAREVITKRPEEFKIAALRDVRALFPDDFNPYVAGFGNKINDVIAYQTVGVPLHKIFTIDPTGAIRVFGVSHEGYTSVNALANHMFPPIKKNEEEVQKEFISWNFFKCDDLSILDSPLPDL